MLYSEKQKKIWKKVFNELIENGISISESEIDFYMEEFSKKYKLQLVPSKRWKQGDIHPETKQLFWCYNSSGSEYWVDEKTFNEKNKIKSIYAKNRAKNDVQFKKRRSLGSALRNLINKPPKDPNKRSFQLVGCTYNDFITHIENQFVEDMSWENRNLWHFDHIKPLSSFDLSKPEQVKKAMHYLNIRPIFSADNIKKKNN